MSDVSPHTEGHKKYGRKPSWGIPFTKEGINAAAEAIADVAWDEKDPIKSMQYILANNESVVNRCGTLMTFSTIIIAISVYIGFNPRLLPNAFQQAIFYIDLLVWIVSTLLLLYSLRHELPPSCQFHKRDDFTFTARLYVRRLGFYNIFLITCMICFMILAALLIPISIQVTMGNGIFPAPN